MGRQERTGGAAEDRDRLLMVVTEAGRVILQRKKRHLAKVMWNVGGKLPAPYVDTGRAMELLGEDHNTDCNASDY